MRKTIRAIGAIPITLFKRKRNPAALGLFTLRTTAWIAVWLLTLLLGTTFIAAAQTEPPRLILLTEPEPTVSFSTRVPIQVRYLDPEGLPIPDTFVAFDPQSDLADSTLSARKALTNQEGVAETYIEAGVQEVDFDVKISVPDDDTVTPISVRVRVQPKDTSDYIIRVNYEGLQTLYSVEVLLFDVDRACSTLIADPSDPPSPDTAWTSLVILPDAAGNIPDRGLNIPAGVELHYAVARATASVGGGAGTDYFVTFGCNDSIPLPDPSSPAVIEITMSDLTTTAINDSYATFENTQLVVLAPGVLANDEESPDGSMPMLAVLEEAPAHGSVKLSGEGGFVYTPDPGYCGVDAFLYSDSNGILESNTATVFLDVVCELNQAERQSEKLTIDTQGWDYDPDRESILVPLLSKFGIATAAEHAGFTAYVSVTVEWMDGTVTGAGTGSGAIEFDGESRGKDHIVSIDPIFVESPSWNGDDDGSGIVTGIVRLVGPHGNTLSTTSFTDVPIQFLSDCPDSVSCELLKTD
jgi:hypothetical protein